MELLTGKAKEDFKKWWYINRSDDVWNYENSPYTIFDFYSLHPSMRDGVIIEWFDSVGIYVKSYPVFRALEVYFKQSVYLKRGTEYSDSILYNTRHEATQEAIIHANKIYNEKN